MTGTSGGQSGTSGGRLVKHLPVLAVLGVGLVVGLINATSKLLEADESGHPLDMRVPFVWEISSIIMVVALTPLVGAAMRRAPPARGQWLQFALVHAIAATLFSALHIAGMVALRKLAFAAAGEVYTFAEGNLLLPVVYEWRKDLLTYAAIALLFWVYHGWRASEALKAATGPEKVAAPGDDRIEIRDGGRIFLIEPAEIAWIEAAGNYVEIHTGAGKHLARGTLAAFETRLAARGFVRVHRSRLVNRARVRALKPTASGDFEITLDDGQTLPGSRRYRAALETEG